MIKLLIVDDSALMRRQLSSLFEAEGDFTIRLARNGNEAVNENIAFEPDVITLDINMPEMDGLTALSLIMAGRPAPVVMISSLTEKGALATFEALNLGAVDYIVKPGGTISLSLDVVRDAIIAKVRTAARARMRLPRKAAEKPLPPLKATVAPVSTVGEGLVMIGVSTGGPSTLELVLPLLSAQFPYPVLVAQHMPGSFTLSFAQRMNELCAMQVVEVSKPMSLVPGTVYIAKGGADLQVVRRVGKLTAIAKPESSEHLWHPSVDLMARSVLEQLDARQVLAVMLTGMGNDGAAAFTEVKRRGGRTIAESKESAVVFGMPAELIKLGGASITLPADKIARQLNAWLGC
ncbi:chemotaxis-specific protein-glutamate methyltransferase CheB [Actimicrobium sp. CCI2.3]|uniref:chemotaxis-specific protein-glutamate methyltransferase CheB n=1 Tax=Actimicrobium sp. CCI2.3 TaxID=3048616 RepID=UPI002AB596E4|nr:chemotaxis-specific protein-glutamate methyltransferase CheB [Actimicrobium sp. CCI2.3]MDY7574810.1 chemotaxis-specific protein-glutamate methyltransferase CheB [Actimicrobium sp. CCI2.3]MEB0020229.1 chemotaxis-specific protein-glutamate methyltransferase CheB [Actimicrobium sp. CCI2.3]